VNTEEFLSLSKGIVGGLVASHEARFIHCQINIDNIMVQQDNTIKIIGLGHAIQCNDDNSSPIVRFKEEDLDLRFISPE